MLKTLLRRVFSKQSTAIPNLVLTVISISSLQTPLSEHSVKKVEIVVDCTLGDDTSLGTPDRPVKTVSQAAQLAMFNRRNGISTTITIHPGTYREFVQLTSVGPEMGASIIFQASQAGAVNLSGSDLWSGWQLDPTDSRIYLHPWQYRWGRCEHPSGWPAIKDLGLRREMVFVNDSPMMQALSRKEMKQGSFFLDEADGVIFLWSPSGAKISESKVEVAVRPGVFESDGVSNLSLKGITFEHANSCLSTKPTAGVVISGGVNNSLEDSSIVWNNWIGLNYFSSTNSTARRLTVNWNGETGINGFRLKGVTFENVETSHNNWRGAEGQFITWEPSGGKFIRTHGGIFRDYVAIGNQGRGMWFDTDNIDVIIDKATIEQNLVGGIDLEANVGPVTIENSRICGNLKEGIQNNQTANVTVVRNIIYNNAKSEIMVGDVQSPRTGANWETKGNFSATSDRWMLSENIIVAANHNQFVYGTLRLPGQPPSTFLNTLTSDNNVWFNPETTDAFQLDPGSKDHPAQILNFAQWQSTTGQDKHSKFVPPDSSLVGSCTVR